MGITKEREWIRDGGYMNVFTSIGWIGDSLSSGEFEYDDGGRKGYWDHYVYSCGKQIERITGIRVTNFSRGGQTARWLYEEADSGAGPNPDINRLFEPAFLKQAYVIALGWNDMKGPGLIDMLYGGKIGSRKDLKAADYRRNGSSFVGWYGKIIQRIQSMQPDTVFFLTTLPNYDGNEEFFVELLAEIARTLPNCYVIDLYHETPVMDEQYRKLFFNGGHMNPAGYLRQAWYNMTLISEIIEKNPEAFRNVMFIGSAYKPLS